MIYMDAGASALKPQSVIDAELDFLKNHYANAGRGVCRRATLVDEMVAKVRQQTAKFIGAKSANQIIFTSGTTDGLNRIPKILNNLKDKTIMATDLDHHSARMPFENYCRDGKNKFILCPLDNGLDIDINNMPQTDVFVITAMSNVVGVAQNVKRIVAHAKELNPNVITVVDAAQYVAHLSINVTDWDCDFLCFSGHKIGADTGLGIMYIKEPDKWHTDKLGGGMVQSLTDNEWFFAPVPAKFEAGTLPLTQIAGLNAAIKTLKQSNDLTDIMRARLSKNPRIKFISPKDAHLLSFTVDGMNHLDFGAIMGAHDVCLRVGNMCASWLHKYLGIPGSCRFSLGPWNTKDDVEKVLEKVDNVISDY